MPKTKIKQNRDKKISEMTPSEVSIGTQITLLKVSNGWIAVRRSNSRWRFPRITSKSRNLILALKKVIGIY